MRMEECCLGRFTTIQSSVRIVVHTKNILQERSDTKESLRSVPVLGMRPFWNYFSGKSNVDYTVVC